MNKKTKEQIVFVLEDDCEIMTAALDSDLDEENKQMNRQLICEHEKIVDKVNRGHELGGRGLD